MKKKQLNSKDLLLSFLYSPGISETLNEPITGRTKLTKMMYLFEKQIYPKFFEDSIEIELPEFKPYYFGPFSKQLFDDLSFFESVGMIISKETDVPLSAAERFEVERSSEDEYDMWSKASFDEESEDYESAYLLSETGKKYVEEQVWLLFSNAQKKKLQEFKAQINRISLDALLRYVYNKYPEDAENSRIAEKYLNKADD